MLTKEEEELFQHLLKKRSLNDDQTKLYSFVQSCAPKDWIVDLDHFEQFTKSEQH